MSERDENTTIQKVPGQAGPDTPQSTASGLLTGKIIQFNEGELKAHLDAKVTQSVEETLNALLDAEADALCKAGRYERNPDRADTRAGHYERQLHTRAGEVTLRVPKLRTLPFETQIIERYRRREESVEEALVEMYLAGVSVRRVEDITEALWGTKVSASAVSELNQKIYKEIEAWRMRPIVGKHAYVYLDGIWLKRNWGGNMENVSVLVAIGVNEEGCREILGVAEGTKEDRESWRVFLRYLKDRGLQGVRLVVSDKCLGLVEAIGEFYPEAAWQRCVVHFYRNVWTAVPKGKMAEATAMLKAIHASEDLEAARKKASEVVTKLKAMKLGRAAEIVESGIEETLTYMRFPREHWRLLRTNNMLERVNKEIRRRTRVVGAFPDGHSALMLVGARLRYIAGNQWGAKRYLSMGLLARIASEDTTGQTQTA